MENRYKFLKCCNIKLNQLIFYPLTNNSATENKAIEKKITHIDSILFSSFLFLFDNSWYSVMLNVLGAKFSISFFIFLHFCFCAIYSKRVLINFISARLQVSSNSSTSCNYIGRIKSTMSNIPSNTNIILVHQI